MRGSEGGRRCAHTTPQAGSLFRSVTPALPSAARPLHARACVRNAPLFACGGRGSGVAPQEATHPGEEHTVTGAGTGLRRRGGGGLLPGQGWAARGRYVSADSLRVAVREEETERGEREGGERREGRER